MSVQIALRLDDELAAEARAYAAASGTTLSEWVRSALRRQALADAALRARAEEDGRPPLRTTDEEDALERARRRRAVAAFPDSTTGDVVQPS
jgi:antitoxin component of RelBE/YafQ-DinJ toxin-antitoxin module